LEVVVVDGDGRLAVHHHYWRGSGEADLAADAFGDLEG
jgi:hypothetical protein